MRRHRLAKQLEMTMDVLRQNVLFRSRRSRLRPAYCATLLRLSCGRPKSIEHFTRDSWCPNNPTCLFGRRQPLDGDQADSETGLRPTLVITMASRQIAVNRHLRQAMAAKGPNAPVHFSGSRHSK